MQNTLRATPFPTSILCSLEALLSMSEVTFLEKFRPATTFLCIPLFCLNHFTTCYTTLSIHYTILHLALHMFQLSQLLCRTPRLLPYHRLCVAVSLEYITSCSQQCYHFCDMLLLNTVQNVHGCHSGDTSKQTINATRHFPTTQKTCMCSAPNLVNKHKLVEQVLSLVKGCIKAGTNSFIPVLVY